MRVYIFKLMVLVLFGSRAWSATMDTDLFVGLAEKVIPSVVNIASSTIVERPMVIPFPTDEFLFGQPKPTMKVFSLGSGILIDAKGVIITNNHVLGNVTELKIQFTESSDEKPSIGKVIGRDQDLDIALIQANLPTGSVPARLGNSDQVKVGEFVLAVGNPFGQGHSLSHGILSAKGRVFPGGPYGGFLQTDAPINPGNSGGPLVNMGGEVIGINTAIQFNAQGISYAIPINLVKEVIPELKSKGKVERGYLGILVEPLSNEVARHLGVSKELNASIVTTVYGNSPAESAGIKPYDLIVGVNGKVVKSPYELMNLMSGVKAGDRMELSVLRENKERKFQVKVAPRPEPEEEMIQKEEKSTVMIHTKSGMRIESLPDEEGVLVTGIIPGGAADRAGLTPGDVILEFDQKQVKSLDQFKRALTTPNKHLLRVIKTILGKEIFSIIELDLS